MFYENFIANHLNDLDLISRTVDKEIKLFSNQAIPKNRYFVTVTYGSPQFNTSFPHKRATPFQPPKSLSSTPKNPQFHTKTHQFHPPQFHTKDPSVPHHKPLSSKPPAVLHQKFLSSTPKNPSVPPPALRSTPKTPQFHTPLSSTLKTLISTHPSDKNCFELKGFWCGTEGCVDQRGFWCWTQGFLEWNWGVYWTE